MPSSHVHRPWRLLVAASGLAGVILAALQYDVWWTALSQLASLGVAAGYLALAVRPAPGTRTDDVVRGGLAVVMVLVGLGFWAMQHGNGADPYSLLEHGLTPALVLLDVVVVGRVRALRRTDPLWWLLAPAAYLTWYVAADLGTYAALDPARPVELAGRTSLLALLVLVAGAALVLRSRPRRPVAVAVPVAA